VTRDLFSDAGEVQAIPLPDADVGYLSSLQLNADAEVMLQELVASVPWRAEEIVVWGKKYPQPRLIAWYGDTGQSYSYSGIQLEPLPWTNRLNSIKNVVERATDSKFNSVLLNYYRNQNDSMGFHSDDEPELGPRPVIASVSLGERRTLIMKHKTRKDLKPVKLPLESGSLLVMQGDTQRNWKHGIDKEPRPCGPRVNLTFRRIYPRVQESKPLQ
jgi:alkylated DNA repair dioxygenase AlkB